MVRLWTSRVLPSYYTQRFLAIKAEAWDASPPLSKHKPSRPFNEPRDVAYKNEKESQDDEV
jgi:hypothetical protein